MSQKHACVSESVVAQTSHQRAAAHLGMCSGWCVVNDDGACLTSHLSVPTSLQHDRMSQEIVRHVTLEQSLSGLSVTPHAHQLDQACLHLFVDQLFIPRNTAGRPDLADRPTCQSISQNCCGFDRCTLAQQLVQSSSSAFDLLLEPFCLALAGASSSAHVRVTKCVDVVSVITLDHASEIFVIELFACSSDGACHFVICEIDLNLASVAVQKSVEVFFSHDDLNDC